MGGVGLVALAQAVRAAAVLTEIDVAHNGADEAAAAELRAAVRALEARAKRQVRLGGDSSQGAVIPTVELGNVSANPNPNPTSNPTPNPNPNPNPDLNPNPSPNPNPIPNQATSRRARAPTAATGGSRCL